MHILVTGGSGFLGRQIVWRLQELGHCVSAPRSAGFDLERGTGLEEYFAALKKRGDAVDAVIHSAAYYGGLGICTADPAGLITRNTRMTVNLFAASAAAGVHKIVSVGSACAYPGALTGVMEEHDIFNGRCHPSVEAYGFNKRLHLVFGAAYAKQYNIEFNQVALTNLYGPHDVFREERSHVISALIKKIVDAKLGYSAAPVLWGSGKPKREFLHVTDAAAVIADALNWATDTEPVNANGEEISIRDLANLIARIAGYDGDIRWDGDKPDGVMRKCLSGRKLQRQLTFSYRPRPLEQGLQQTIEWYIANKEDADARL